MSHVFEGEPDERQSSDRIEVSRFRPRYRALSPEEKATHDLLKLKAEEIERLIDGLPDGRYKSLAMTSLEESIMWAVKQLTA